jgi:hypothetical protein
MALTAAHPGVVRWRKRLWITDPDAKNAKRAPTGPPLRGGSPWAYLIVAVVFAVVILLSIHVPWSTQKQVAGWVPGADVEGGFQGLLVVGAIVLLGAIAWMVYGKPETAIAGTPVRTRVAVDVFADVGVEVNDEMAWNDLWELGRSIEELGDAAAEEFEAKERGDRAEALRVRRLIEVEITRAKRASRKLGVEPDLTFYEDAPTA